MTENQFVRERALIPQASADEATSPSNVGSDRDILDFDPAALRHRIDGWTPQKQREYVEALADSGVARYAAARVGMSEQSASRLRRRADARSFDRACEAAMRIGARRLFSVACERAIEGTVKRYHYHGEVKGEERVYDNRLLIALIGKLGPLLLPSPESAAVAGNWQGWMEAIEQGLPKPPARPAKAPPPAATVPEDRWDGDEVWQDDDGTWWTGFPPPHGFDGEEIGVWGRSNYQRSLTPAEQAVIDADEAEQDAEDLAHYSARRDRYFGFAAEEREAEVFPPRGSELYETSEPSAPPPGEEPAPPEQPGGWRKVAKGACSPSRPGERGGNSTAASADGASGSIGARPSGFAHWSATRGTVEAPGPLR